MIFAEDIRPGHLLISEAHELYCVVEIKLNLDYPDKSIITGVNNKKIKLSGTPDQWFHLWESSINIMDINI